VPGTAARTWRAADAWHIDVRGLSAPAPLVAILRLVESIEDATPVIVHHDRDPQLLYPELAERGWGAQRIAGEPGEVRLKLAAGLEGDEPPPGDGGGPCPKVA
jgi:hypothetical protein